MSKQLIFLLGLPRSGTTLLQRILAVHPEIKSVAEPWVLLPLLTHFNKKISASIYGQNTLSAAIMDLKNEAQNFQQYHDNYVRSFIYNIYSDIRGDSKYFLDKTPRYYLIAEELHRIFPDAKFIYLMRNPIDVFDSAIDTFCNGRLDMLPFYEWDFMHGFNTLNKSLCDSQNTFIKVKYEDLCTKSETVVKQVCDYLDIDYKDEMLTEFSGIEFSGNAGDTKRNLHRRINSETKVKSISIVRRHLYKKWLSNISNASWQASGYGYAEVVGQLQSRQWAGFHDQIMDFISLLKLNFTVYKSAKTISSFKAKYLGNNEGADGFLY